MLYRRVATEIRRDRPQIKPVRRKSVNVLTALLRFKDAIKECEKPPRYSDPALLFQALHKQLHNLEFLTVDKSTKLAF
jgi:hypothetical protein